MTSEIKDVVLSREDGSVAHGGLELLLWAGGCWADDECADPDSEGWVQYGPFPTAKGGVTATWKERTAPVIADAVKTPRPKSVVYFIGMGNPTTHVKIGVTKNGAEGRRQQLQVGCPMPLSLLATVPGSFGLENGLHHEFSDLRRNGEWFEYTDALAARIRGLAEEA